MTTATKPSTKVLQEEEQELRTRRKTQGVPVEPNEPLDDVTGLALSGGGVRSAAFSLGFLRSLYSNGRLKFIDYLSTVSGGGYAGALFSTAVSRSSGNINWDRNGVGNRLDFEGARGSGLPERVQRLALHGRLMNNLLRMFSRHLWGLIVNTVFLLSGVVTIAALLAILFRMPWNPDNLPVVMELGFNTDIRISFFFPFLAFLIWIGCQLFTKVARSLGKDGPPINQYAYVLLLGSLGLGVITMMAVGDLETGNWFASDVSNNRLRDNMNLLTQWGGVAISAIFASTLLPYLNPRRLLRSGNAEAGRLQSLAFNTAGKALLFGVPLFTFFVLVHEDRAGWTLGRPDSDQFTRNHVGRIGEFETKLRIDQSGADSALTKIARGIEDVLKERDHDELVQLEERQDIDEEEVNFPSRWLQWIASTTHIDDQFEQRVRNRENSRLHKERIVARLNRQILSDPRAIIGQDGKLSSDVLQAALADRGRLGPDTARKEKNEIASLFVKISRAAEVIEDRLDEGGDVHAAVKAYLRNTGDGKYFAKIDEVASMDSYRLLSLLTQQTRLPPEPRLTEAKVDNWLKHEGKLLDSGVRTIRESNWELLHMLYPRSIRRQATVFAGVVNVKDQEYRSSVAFYSLVVFLLFGLLTNLNNTSLHGVYRDQLAEIWLEDRALKLHEIDSCVKGGPYHLINATVNRMGHRNDPDIEGRSRFVLSSRFCGTKKVGYRETKKYLDGNMTVADAVAISGAAVTSVTAPSTLQQFMLFVTNFRLGQWLPNPHTFETDHYWPSPIRCLLNLMWHPEQRSYLFNSDGGHLDNTGLASLLERRCRLMICVDGSEDPSYRFSDLTLVLDAARAKYGVHFTPIRDERDTLEKIRPPKGKHISEEHFVVYRVEYPDADEGAILIYAKLSLTGDEPVGLVERARRSGDPFPYDPTSNQFLTADTFEAYVALGAHIGDEIDKFVESGEIDGFDVSGWTSPTPDLGKTPDAALTNPVASIQMELHDATFDPEAIKRAWHLLAELWLTLPASEAAGAAIETVSMWSRATGTDANFEYRELFCRLLGKHVNAHRSDIVRNNTLRLHCLLMLEALGCDIDATQQTFDALLWDEPLSA